MNTIYQDIRAIVGLANPPEHLLPSLAFSDGRKTDSNTSINDTAHADSALSSAALMSSVTSDSVGVSKLNASINPTFAFLCQSTGSGRSPQISGRILAQTLFVSTAKPATVTIDQYMLTTFGGGLTGSGVFTLTERNANDLDVYSGVSGRLSYFPKSGFTKISGGTSEVIIGHKTSGILNGVSQGPNHTSLTKMLVSDKVYRLYFTPGTAGAGAYSIRFTELPVRLTTSQKAAQLFLEAGGATVGGNHDEPLEG